MVLRTVLQAKLEGNKIIVSQREEVLYRLEMSFSGWNLEIQTPDGILAISPDTHKIGNALEGWPKGTVTLSSKQYYDCCDALFVEITPESKPKLKFQLHHVEPFWQRRHKTKAAFGVTIGESAFGFDEGGVKGPSTDYLPHGGCLPSEHREIGPHGEPVFQTSRRGLRRIASPSPG
jgi:hypothetical protein